MPPGWLSWSAIFPYVWVGPKTSFTLWSCLFSPYSKGIPAVIAGITGVYLSRVTWWPTVHSGWWLPAPDGCLDQTCYLWWSMPELSAVYNSPLQTWCQTYIDGYDQQLSTKSVEHARRAPKKVSASILMDGSMPTTTSQADFLGNVKNKGRLVPITWWMLE